MDDKLCLELIMNTNKHKRKNKAQDGVPVSPFVKNYRKTVGSFETVILSNPTVLSNFDVFLERLSAKIYRLVNEFDKDLHNKRD